MSSCISLFIIFRGVNQLGLSSFLASLQSTLAGLFSSSQTKRRRNNVFSCLFFASGVGLEYCFSCLSYFLIFFLFSFF